MFNEKPLQRIVRSHNLLFLYPNPQLFLFLESILLSGTLNLTAAVAETSVASEETRRRSTRIAEKSIGLLIKIASFPNVYFNRLNQEWLCPTRPSPKR